MKTGNGEQTPPDSPKIQQNINPSEDVRISGPVVLSNSESGGLDSRAESSVLHGNPMSSNDLNDRATHILSNT